jgi:hypothetical protein
VPDEDLASIAHDHAAGLLDDCPPAFLGFPTLLSDGRDACARDGTGDRAGSESGQESARTGLAAAPPIAVAWLERRASIAPRRGRWWGRHGRRSAGRWRFGSQRRSLSLRLDRPGLESRRGALCGGGVARGRSRAW